MNNVYFPVPNHTTNPMSLFEDPDCSVLGCSESCICEGVGLGPVVNLNKDPKKCFRLTAKTIIRMFREGSNGVQKKEIKQYLRDSDLRFTHTLFDIVDKGLRIGMSNGYIVRKGRSHLYYFVSKEEQETIKEQAAQEQLRKEKKKAAKRKKAIDRQKESIKKKKRKIKIDPEVEIGNIAPIKNEPEAEVSIEFIEDEDEEAHSDDEDEDDSEVDSDEE